MIQVQQISSEHMEKELDELGIFVPLEQTKLWSTFEAQEPGKAFWGACKVVEEENGEVKPLAYISFMDYETHGYHFLRAHHGPLYVDNYREDATPDRVAKQEDAEDVARNEPAHEPTGGPQGVAEEPHSAVTRPHSVTYELESKVVDALSRYVHERDPRVVFLRMAIQHELPQTRYVLSTSPYETTVIIDLAGRDPEAILANFKARGRRDVRKALRECAATLQDETAQATEDFTPYYRIMQETAARDGFTPAPKASFARMLAALGPDHIRLYAMRNEGELVSWSLITVNGAYATKYYAASDELAKRIHAVDKSIIEECCALAELGCTSYDLMGIGSDFSPSLKSLNEFKTKFSQEIVPVAPDRDVPLRKHYYLALSVLQKLRGRR